MTRIAPITPEPVQTPVKRWRGQTLPERLASRVLISEGGCWIWLGKKSSDGYGYVSVANKSRLAHRVAFELRFGSIPDGLTIDHICRHRDCVNPDHLEAVTIRDNVLRGKTLPARNVSATHCVNGHLFDEANTRVRENGLWRACRACAREYSRRHKARKTVAVDRA